MRFFITKHAVDFTSITNLPPSSFNHGISNRLLRGLTFVT